MSDIPFTGERLHAGGGLFGVDLARHRAAYVFAQSLARGRRVLDLGCGSGYGAAELSVVAPGLVGIDRVAPDAASRVDTIQFLRADIGALPIQSHSFDLIVSFQVIEHLEDPSEYLGAVARMLRPEGTALFTTPNILTSDRENPFHLHEYEASELETAVGRYFGDVEMQGVGATPPVARYLEARLARIRRIVRLDPLGLRRRLPQGFVEWMFGRLALVVRRGIAQSEGLPDVTWQDFPLGAASDDCVDLLAICRNPRLQGGTGEG